MDHKVEKLLYSKQAAAEALSLSVRSIDYLITTQRLPMRRVGGKVMIPASAVRRFAREDHPERVRGDGHTVSIYSETCRQVSETHPNRFGPKSETMDVTPLLRANSRA
jgi:outer membrane lipoprotein-sorting protein